MGGLGTEPRDAADPENANSALASAEIKAGDEIAIWHLQVPKVKDFPMEAFLSIGFTHHRPLERGFLRENHRPFLHFEGIGIEGCEW